MASMITLPPDFWTKPQPGWLTGFIVGAVIGAALSFYFVPSTRNVLSRQYYLTGKFITAAAAAIGALIGLVVGSLVALYLGN